jgi:hypothetical protein
MILRAMFFVVMGLVGCRDVTGKDVTNKQDPPATTPTPPPVTGSAVGSVGSADGSAVGSDNGYVPAEFKTGMARWKDTVVYALLKGTCDSTTR